MADYRKLGRFAAGWTAEKTARLAGKLGTAGVLVGSGEGYAGKMYDGVAVAPKLAAYGTRVLTDLDRMDRVGEAIQLIKQGNAWEQLKNFDFKGAYDSLSRTGEAAGKLAGVASELDYNGIWTAVMNLADNVSDKP